MTENFKKLILRRLSKITCGATLLLIYIGGLVTSTGSGLSVPDWPLSYGMVFPPMVGGVFYEHGHRMVATIIGFLMLCLTILTAKFEKRIWVRNLSFFALGAVLAQGILGGITVKMFLPLWVSVSHGVLAQTFLVLTVLLAYSFSHEREQRDHIFSTANRKFLWATLLLIACIYLQLIIGAVMRHSHSGLAIPDFPTMGGEWWPRFDQSILNAINANRFSMNLEPVTLDQVTIHFTHRFMAAVLLGLLLILNYLSFKAIQNHLILSKSLFVLNSLFVFQIFLGIVTVMSQKEYHFTSLHVATGAATLAWTILVFLRAAPLRLKELQSTLTSRND